MSRDTQPVAALARGLAILEVFGRKGFSLHLADVAQEMGLAKSTAYRLLATLVSLGYLDQPVKGGLYNLGPRVLALGYAALESLDVREAAQPYLDALFEQANQNVNLSILDNDAVIYVGRRRQADVLSLNLHVGSRLPLHSSSPGRVLMAFLPDEERADLVRRVRDDPQAGAWLAERGFDLAAHLELVREQGYAVNDGEYLPELFALAAPVLGKDGRAQAALSLACLKHGLTADELVRRYLPPLMENASKVSALLGWRPALEVRGI